MRHRRQVHLIRQWQNSEAGAFEIWKALFEALRVGSSWAASTRAHASWAKDALAVNSGRETGGVRPGDLGSFPADVGRSL